MWLDINHITVHNNTLFIYFKTQKELLIIQKFHNKLVIQTQKQLLKIQKLHNKLVIYVIYTHTLTFEWIYLFRNATDCRLSVLDLGTQNCLPLYQMEEAHNGQQGHGCCHQQSPKLSIPHDVHTTDLVVLIFHPQPCHTHSGHFCFSHSSLQTSTGMQMLKLIQYNSGRKCVKQQY